MGMADELKAARNESAGSMAVSGTRRTDMPKINYGSSRLTTGLASGTIILLFAGVWYLGANATYTWLKSLGLKIDDFWLVAFLWLMLAGISAIEITLKPRFTDILHNFDVFMLWAIILAIDTGTTFFGLVILMAGWKVPLYFFNLNLPKGSIELGIVAFILSVIIALAPEPMIRKFLGMFLKVVGV